ncbi:thioredoxin family protein [Pseudochrobactrum asaccharolyticum]|uniref:Thioredoxin n=1 Tax=Pseudochrobactrum asaccharolyticum TaxID=354351 RepID=A0A366ECN0_9HYPH|nr:thioredoxin domain-containing protein [Pseudochrobactrum asaccharolyticum]MDR2312193.1 thioredoxin fold domain-containing protein [Brucellaceae bacterium]RBO99234.1 thioredoxin 1/thioredoxin 2 [Pseudochrobactrum asaccharolyticum]
MLTSPPLKYEATEVSSTELNTMLRENETAILVYVWAPWCPPCKSMTPALDDVAAEIGQNVRVVKLNAVSESQTLTALGIASVPTLLLFSAEGRELARFLGALNSSAILDWISKNNTLSCND